MAVKDANYLHNRKSKLYAVFITSVVIGCVFCGNVAVYVLDKMGW